MDEMAKLSAEQRAMLTRWPHGDEFVYGGPNSHRGSVGPSAVAKSLINIGYANLVPWKYGSQLALLPAGLSAHIELTRAALNAAGGKQDA